MGDGGNECWWQGDYSIGRGWAGGEGRRRRGKIRVEGRRRVEGGEGRGRRGEGEERGGEGGGERKREGRGGKRGGEGVDAGVTIDH